MNTEKDKINWQKASDNDVLFADYKPLETTTTVEDVDCRKARGSVRLITGNVLAPAEVEEMFKKVLSLDFE
jgi:hypothetical protein